MMKLFLFVVGLFVAVAAHEPIGLNYHETVGIPEATRIKNAEAAMDFDGARIVGGSLSQLGAFPYLGGLVITLTSGATSVCGSSMLSNTKFVTAAHCWSDGWNQARQFVVVVGSVTLFSGGTRVTTSNVVMHEGYNTNNLNNDIAIFTTSWISYTTTISNVALASGSNNYAGTWATAAGFGRTSDSTGISTNQVMSHANLQVITNEVCSRTFGTNVIVASTLCVSTTNGQSTCGGDSGGPLVVTGPTLIGITSFGSAAGCQRGFPAGFARVTSFNAWISARL